VGLLNALAGHAIIKERSEERNRKTLFEFPAGKATCLLSLEKPGGAWAAALKE